MKTVSVIGSGISGLITALLLDRRGYKVTVIEKEKQVGGMFKPFRRGGLDFEFGLHFCGSLGEGSFLYKKFRDLGLFDYLEIDSKKTINTLVFNSGRVLHLPAGTDKFEEYIRTEFPDEPGLNTFFEFTKEMSSDFIRSFREREPIFPDKSLDECMEGKISSKELKFIFRYFSYFYGCTGGKGDMAAHSFIMNEIISGCACIKGGGKAVIEALMSMFSENVNFITGKKALHIVQDGGRFHSLILDDKTEIYSDLCVSTIHLRNLPHMIDIEGKKIGRFFDRIKKKENGYSVFSIYGAYSGEKFDDVYVLDETGNPSLCLLVGESATGTYPLTIMMHADYNEWLNKETYSNKKKHMEQYILQAACKLIFFDINQFHLLDSSTPLTIERYTGSTEGSCYGFLNTLQEKRCYPTTPFTPVRNFFCGGQSVFYPGLLGCYCSSEIIVEIIETTTV